MEPGFWHGVFWGLLIVVPVWVLLWWLLWP